MPTIYTILKTVFRDDYKPRGDWSESTVKVFRYEKEAEEHIKREKISFLCDGYELLDEKEVEEIEKITGNLCKDVGLNVLLNMLTDDQLDMFYEKANKGEFVSCRLSLELQEHKI